MPPKQQTKPLPKAVAKKPPTTVAKKPITTVAKRPTTTIAKPTTKSLPKANPQPYSAPKPPQQQGWIARTTSAAASGIGNFAGAIVTAAGNGVAGAGKGAGSS